MGRRNLSDVNISIATVGIGAVSKLQPELMAHAIHYFSSDAASAAACLSVCQIFNFTQSFFFAPSVYEIRRLLLQFSFLFLWIER